MDNMEMEGVERNEKREKVSQKVQQSSDTVESSAGKNDPTDSTPVHKQSDMPSAAIPLQQTMKIAKPKPEPIIAYNGQTITSAASQGNLPVCVLLWGMASAKKQSLMTPDAQGNNPMHYACLAPTAEVLGFFQQQLRGMLTPELRLIDARNDSGETPLLRAMSTGQMLVIKALIDEGSDVLAVDRNGNNVLINCAKNCQFWCLNYMYNHIRNVHGVEAVYSLIVAQDCNGWNSLDWAVEAGDLNCVELLIRKGLSPFRVTSDGQSLLHIAFSRHRIDVACFLLDMGCDPHCKDGQGIVAVNYHSLQQDHELRWAVYAHPAVSRLSCQKLSVVIAHNRGLQDIENGVEIPRMESPNGRSFAIRRLSPTRLSAVLAYAGVIFGMWLLAICVPFYAWIPFVAAVAGSYSYFANKVGTLQQRAAHARGRLLLEPWQQIIGAPEKYVGFWLGNVMIYIFYFLNVIAFTYTTAGDDDVDDHTAFISAVRSPMGLSGLDCMKKDRVLVWSTIIFMAITIVCWARIMFFATDPGIVDTRQRDFDEIMTESMKAGGNLPDNTTYCRTTLVKKPVRSKFCTKSGFVVARMDHHCVWLNNAIGYGNHRSFMAFLYFHLLTNVCGIAMFIRILARDTVTMSPSSVTGELVSQRMLLITSLTIFLLLINCFIGLLVVEQTHNILTNITTNEKVNRSRYWWMKGPDGRPLNRFDKGVWHNTMEFLCIPGYAIDYRNILERADSKALLNDSNDETKIGTELTTTSPLNHVHDHNCKHHH